MAKQENQAFNEALFASLIFAFFAILSAIAAYVKYREVGDLNYIKVIIVLYISVAIILWLVYDCAGSKMLCIIIQALFYSMISSWMMLVVYWVEDKHQLVTVFNTFNINIDTRVLDICLPFFQAIVIVASWHIIARIMNFLFSEWLLDLESVKFIYCSIFITIMYSALCNLIISWLNKRSFDTILMRYACNNVAILLGAFVSFDLMHSILYDKKDGKNLLLKELEDNFLKARFLLFPSIFVSLLLSLTMIDFEVNPQIPEKYEAGLSVITYMFCTLVLFVASICVWILYFRNKNK